MVKSYLSRRSALAEGVVGGAGAVLFSHDSSWSSDLASVFPLYVTTGSCVIATKVLPKLAKVA